MTPPTPAPRAKKKKKKKTGAPSLTTPRPPPMAPHMRLVIGFAEMVDLPDWDFHGIRAKVDTGARTSALHVDKVRLLADGKVRFRIVPDDGDPSGRRIESPLVRTAMVRSSTGHQEERHFVRTRLRVGPIEKEIEVSLASRGEMRYPMLLGRSALTGEFLIDVSKRYTVGGPHPVRGTTKKKKKKKKKAAKKTSAKKKAKKKTRKRSSSA